MTNPAYFAMYVLSSAVVSDPLHLLDICATSDGTTANQGLFGHGSSVLLSR